MTLEVPRFTVFAGGDPGAEHAPGVDVQALWFSLASRPWASLVLVPAHAEGAAGSLATTLAAVGTRLRETPVTAIIARAIDAESVRTLVRMQPRIVGRTVRPRRDDLDRPLPGVAGAPGSRDEGGEGPVAAPLGRVIVAIPPVIDEPLGIDVARAADAVVLCFDLGESRLRAARRTIELVGADRIIGAVVAR